MNRLADTIRIRETAKQLHRRHFGKLLLMGLAAAGICLALMLAGMAILLITTGGPWWSTARYLDASGINQPYRLGLAALQLIVFLTGSGLLLGLLQAMLRLCRGEDVSVGKVFSGMRHSLKALGMNLWICTAILLWALPGFLLTMGGAMFWAVCIDSLTGELTLTPEEQQIIGAVILAGMILSCLLGIPAIFRHALAPLSLADDPSAGIWDCAASSKARMKGRKWQLFRLLLPFLLAIAALWLGASALADVSLRFLPGDFVSGLVSTVLFLLACAGTLVIVLRGALCMCLFHLGIPSPVTPAEASAFITNDKAKETEP